MNSGGPVEEFNCICEFMRHYATLHLYRLTLLLGTTGGVITGICSESIRASGLAAVLMLKLGAVAVSLAFPVMDYRAGAYWPASCSIRSFRCHRRGARLRRSAPGGISTYSFSCFGW